MKTHRYRFWLHPTTHQPRQLAAAADNNTLKVPDAATLPDDKVLFLSDILPTAWHANELAEVGTGDNVAIWWVSHGAPEWAKRLQAEYMLPISCCWMRCHTPCRGCRGCGPVGILAAHCAQVRGAARVVLVDSQADRLHFAKSKLPGVETVNCKERDTLSQLKDMFKDERGRYIGPDAVIEAVGFHYTSNWQVGKVAAIPLRISGRPAASHARCRVPCAGVTGYRWRSSWRPTPLRR